MALLTFRGLLSSASPRCCLQVPGKQATSLSASIGEVAPPGVSQHQRDFLFAVRLVMIMLVLQITAATAGAKRGSQNLEPIHYNKRASVSTPWQATADERDLPGLNMSQETIDQTHLILSLKNLVLLLMKAFWLSCRAMGCTLAKYTFYKVCYTT